MSGGDLGLLSEKLDETFPAITQAAAREARITVRINAKTTGLNDADELIRMLGLTEAQMRESRFAESPPGDPDAPDPAVKRGRRRPVHPARISGHSV